MWYCAYKATKPNPSQVRAHCARILANYIPGYAESMHEIIVPTTWPSTAGVVGAFVLASHALDAN